MTGSYFLANTQPVSSDVQKIAFIETDAVKYVDASGTVRALIRVVLPIKGGMPAKFNLKVDEVRALAGLKSE